MPSSACPEPTILSAWIDGGLDAPTAAAIEAHLAGCAECVETVREVRAVLAAPRERGPATFALQRAVADALRGRHRHDEPPLVLVLRWTLAAAAAVAACWIGFHAGTGVAPSTSRPSVDPLVDTMTFGLLDGDAEGVNDDLLQFALAASNVGLTEVSR